MTLRTGRFSILAAALLFAVGLAIPAHAQTYQGRIDITVTDSTGAVLPGVTVDITGPEQHEAVTDAQGQVHFLNLSVGTYTVKAALQGFETYTNTAVVVTAASPVVLPVQMGVAGVKTAVEVTAEAPVISPKKETVGSTISQQELADIPTARDPWVILETVPTIITDRVNVGGSESGQQSNYLAKGASGTDNTWNIDGIPVTDMGATGSSPTYFDFDAFKEMQVTTGGSDPSISTPGAQLNLVLKSGSNTPHGDARYYFENQSLQGSNLPADLAASLGGATGKGNRTNSYKDGGFNVGGPLMKDKLWAWGSYGRTDIDNIILTGAHDKTTLENYAFKVTDQLTSNIRPEFMYFRGNKVKKGRSAGVTRPPETTWDQTGPTTIYKGQISFVIGNNMFLTARGAQMPSGFSLTPEGGLSASVYRDVNRVWHGSYIYYATDRPQSSTIVDGNYFKGKHEVKFGFAWRRATVTSSTVWPGGGYTIDLSGNQKLIIPVRSHFPGAQADYYSAYAGDTISFNRATVNLAVRYDREKGSALQVSDPVNPLAPTVLPAVVAPAAAGPEWSLVSPRVGITYALDESRKTIARASYSMFSSQMGAGGNEAGYASAAAYSYAYYIAPGTGAGTAADVANGTFLGGVGLTPGANQVSSSLVSPKTHEILAGLDRELMPNFGLSATFTYRRYTDMTWTPLIGVTSADYNVDGTVTGTAAPIGSYSQTYYALAASAAGNGGHVLSNHPGYYQRYMGFEVEATKRMSNHWMGRFGFSTASDNEYFSNPGVAIQDPTKTPTNPQINGGPVVTSSTGSGKSGIYLVAPKWQFTADGLYEGPWGLNFGGNLVARQGYAEPYYAGNVTTSDPLNPSKNVLLASSVDQYRLPGVILLSARVEKGIKLGTATLDLDFDVFNLFNNATVLGRQYDLNSGSSANNILEIMNPRIARLGVRFTF
ncbi:MAG: TonB-dependent receptor [Acidobacteriota bacterium]|nr:TonB-dependent receptor [Acidobacteriota bacterium]